MKSDAETPADDEFGPAPTMEQYERASTAAMKAYVEVAKAEGFEVPHARALTLVHGAACAATDEWTELEGNDRPQIANFIRGCRTSAHQALAFFVSSLIHSGRLDEEGNVVGPEAPREDAATGKVWH